MLKNKGKGKVAAAVLAAALAISQAASVSSYAADSNVIYEKSDKQVVTQGVTLENIIRFTTNGWYNFNIMKVDMTNQYITVDALTNAESIGKLATTKKLAAQKSAVAAVNTSFFTPDGSGFGHPIGTVIQNSSVLCASGDFNKYSNSMATLSLSKLNEILLDYWKCDMNLTNQNGSKVAVAQYNKPNGNKYTGITVFDRKWGAAAVGVTADMPDLFQMVVADGKVAQFLPAQPAAPIPENGFVVVTRTEGAKALQQAFAVGDSISFNIGSTPDWSNFKMAVSGSCLLLKNGQIPQPFSFSAPDIVISSPKTAIGSSQDGKTLYMVTVDGRQTSSVGLSLKDMALFMKNLGAWNAINMDGGGSTTMVARPSGEKDVQVMNSPSDGISRSVATAVGVFTSAPAAPLAGMIVETPDKYMFTNTTRTLTVKGYDGFNNPMEVDPALIKWSVSGVKGTFKGNVFKAATNGEAKITASIGEIKASVNVSVLTTPARLILSSQSIKLPVGQTKTFTITGVNLKGYSATIDPVDVKWSISSKIGSFTNGVFTAEQKGSGYIDAAVDKAHAYCAVSISADTASVIDQFEAINGSFQAYPDTVKGTYSISNEQKVSGNSSGKLTYDFTLNPETSRAAYLVLGNGGYTLNADISKIGLQVFNDHENSGWLRAELYDAKGEKQVVDLVQTMGWTGWKYVEASIDSISLPAKLTRLYLVQVNPVLDSGSIYLDDLTITSSGYPTVDTTKIPKDTVPVDDTNKAVSFSKATADSFRFGVLGQSRAPKNALEKKLMTRFAEKVDGLLEAGVVVGDGSHSDIAKLVKKKPFLLTANVDLKATKAVDYKYSVTDIKNSRFIKLDTRADGLRRSDSAQWQAFQKDLDSFKGKNVFLFLENAPSKFSDKLELGLFKDTITKYRLNTGRNVWVFYNGDKNETYMEKGVKYISAAGYEVSGLKANNTDVANYVLVTVKGSAVTFIFRPIL